MYENNCHYNPDRDIQAVVPTEVIDICDAFVNGLIPENVVAPDTEYDGCDNPDAIVGRPANEFEAVHMTQGIKTAVSESKETKD